MGPTGDLALGFAQTVSDLMASARTGVSLGRSEPRAPTGARKVMEALRSSESDAIQGLAYGSAAGNARRLGLGTGVRGECLRTIS